MNRLKANNILVTNQFFDCGSRNSVFDFITNEYLFNGIYKFDISGRDENDHYVQIYTEEKTQPRKLVTVFGSMNEHTAHLS